MRHLAQLRLGPLERIASHASEQGSSTRVAIRAAYLFRGTE
ncbi:MAG: hypothetical protein ACI9KE_005152 [Polyangiales bacterium]|jgi:hypothetical protein